MGVSPSLVRRNKGGTWVAEQKKSALIILLTSADYTLFIGFKGLRSVGYKVCIVYKNSDQRT